MWIVFKETLKNASKNFKHYAKIAASNTKDILIILAIFALFILVQKAFKSFR
jgi:hypothetical protein